MGSRTPWICAAIWGALSLRPALAQGAPPPADDRNAPQQGIRIDQSQPAPPESAFFHAEGPHAPAGERVEFAVGLTGDYAFKPIQVRGVDSKDGETHLGSPVRHAGLVFLGASITPVHWLNFDLSMPFALFESGDTITTKGYGDLVRETDTPKVGDIRVGAHVRPKDTRELGIVLGARLWAAIGSDLAFLSDSRFRFELDVGFAGEGPEWLRGCTLGVAPTFFAQRTGDRIAVSCALHRKVETFLSVGIEPTLALFADAKNFGVDYRVLFEPLAAARFRVGDFRFGVGAGPGYGSAAGTAAFRMLLEGAYVGGGVPEKPPPPPPPDADLDGILDKDDACPKEAGPASQDSTKNGCPSLDRDADGIRDEEDWCPDRPGIHHQNPNANGCPDSDNDQLPDPIDQCRNEPGAPPSGCPKFARLQRDAFRIDPPIQFVDARSATLTTEGRSALEEVAATMRANPKIEQLSVQLGTKGVKADLSDKRAQQIILLLRNANLDNNRFEVVLRDDLKAGNVEVKVIR